MRTSVVIPSYNPEVKLSETLERLVPQSSLIDELIVIIDNDKYADFAKSLQEKYSPKLKIKIVPQTNAGRAASRNNGAKLSTGDIIIFLDDDMLAEVDLIERHVKHHSNKAGSILSGNGYRNPKDAKYDFGKFLIKTEEGWKNQSGGNGEVTFREFNFTACNMSLSKRVFEQLNGFDTRFSDGEDFDFAIRAMNNNVRVIYDSTALAWHNDWPEIDTYIKRLNEYTLAKAEIAKAHPEYLKYFPDLLGIKRNKSKKLLLKIIRHTFGKFVIVKNRIFTLLPLQVKFLFYKIIIAAYSYGNI